MVAYPNLRPTYVIALKYFMAFEPCSTHSPFTLETSGIPNHVTWATDSDILNQEPAFSHQEHCMYQTTCPYSNNSLPWIMFSFNKLTVICREEVLFETERPRSRGWKNFGRRWMKGVGGLKNWTIFMDVICVLSLMSLGF